jgi:lysophospholipase L1-like esterase
MRMKQICIAVGFVLVPIAAAWALQEKEAPEKRWEKTIQEFEKWDTKNAWPKKPVLFAGSSSIRMWPTRDAFPELPLINRGFGGSQISDVNYFIERIVLKYKPRLIVFYCGDNDISVGKSPEQVFADYQEFVSRVHSDLPKTKIIYISIKPSGSRWKLWPQMKQANEKIQTFSENNKRLYYADCGTCLLTEKGEPNDELFIKDRLHLNEKGYAKWKTVLLPILQEALKKEKKKK